MNEEGRGGKEGEERDKGVIYIFSNTLATQGSAVPRYTVMRYALVVSLL